MRPSTVLHSTALSYDAFPRVDGRRLLFDSAFRKSQQGGQSPHSAGAPRLC